MSESDGSEAGLPETWRRQLEVLGDRDPDEVLTTTPDVLLGMASRHETELLHRRPAEGAWSPAEVVGHLLDTEWVFAYRLRIVRLEAEPAFAGFDQDRWVQLQRWNDRSLFDTAGRFGVLRAFTVDLYGEFRDEDRSRSGRHTGEGCDVSLEQMWRIHAGHDLVHIAQIERALSD